MTGSTSDDGAPDGDGLAPRLPEGVKAASVGDALIALASLVVLIGGSLLIFDLDALDGPIQVALVLCCGVAAAIGMKNGWRWEHVEVASQGAMSSITSAVFILLAVGALIGTRNLSGTIPTLVYYGIQFLSPSWYYLAAAVICGVVALSIGSSWTTAGTIGVGLIGIAGVIGVSPAITAGAVISGAYLGDKTSPLSETTILTAQMVKADLYDHIRAQIWTSIPAFVIACVGFGILGVAGPAVNDTIATAMMFSPKPVANTADSSTVTSPLIPWNSCGAFMGAVLGVSTLSYLPYAFFNLASPLLSVLYGFTGFKIERLVPDAGVSGRGAG